MLLYYVCVLLVFLFGSGLGQQKNNSAVCESKNGGNAAWTCKKISDCKFAQQLLSSKQPTFCGRDGRTQKICCPYQNDPLKIVRDKCKQYAELRMVEETQTIKGSLTKVRVPYCQAKPSKTTTNVESLIVGGTPAAENEFPHMALIGSGEQVKDIQWTCGGSLISEKYILSAAHCSDIPSKLPAWALLGELVKPADVADFTNKDNLVKIEQRINHPAYKAPALENDIALFKLKRPIKFSLKIRPICLTRPAPKIKSFKELNRTVLISGWGKTGVEFTESDILLKAEILHVHNQTCANTYKTDSRFTKGFDGNTMICAGGVKEKDTCQGDSGGPLQSIVDDPQYQCLFLQEGITSYGSFFCADGSPAVYTRVSAFLPWIQSIVWPS